MTDPERKDEPDPRIGTSPRLRDQPALTTSTGRAWLICGGLLGLIAIGVLIPLLPDPPAGLALTAICATVLLYAGMVIARVNMRPGRGMLGVLATLMIVLALTDLIIVGVVAAVAGKVAF